MQAMGHIDTMANTNPLRFDLTMQIRVDQAFKDDLDRLKTARGERDGSRVIRDMVREAAAKLPKSRTGVAA